tara:strand:- start:200 stop:382 length:183 start_codon:yes stop_codon:yes gene_type:complete
MDCPKCLDKPHGEFYASQDKLWCEFDAQVIDGWLYTVYYCRNCDWNEQKKFCPQVMHDEN